jgi:transposase-like protein
MPSGSLASGFPPEVTLRAVRRYLRFGLSCRAFEELLAERGMKVGPVTFRWVDSAIQLSISTTRAISAEG